MRKRRLMIAAGGVVAIAVALAGCAGTSSTPSGAATGHSTISPKVQSELAPYLKPTTELTVNTPLSKTPPKGKKVFMLSNGIEITQLTAAGIKAASGALGWSFSTISVDASNPTTTNSAMLSAVAQGADVVILTATDLSIYSQALAVAKQHGTVVIDMASGNKPTPGVTALVNNASHTPIWGKIAALGILADAQKADKDANVAIVTAPVFDTILGPGNTAVENTVKANCTACTVGTIPISAGDLFAGKTPPDVVSYLQSHPTVNYLMLGFGGFDDGLRPALQAAGFGKVKIFGIAPVETQLKSVSAGEEGGWVSDPLAISGWMAVDAAARSFTGDDPTAYDKVGIPTFLFTKKTAGLGAEVPVDYQSQFEKMWGLKN
jgi:ABC-type sugar transport system substrate-binding protein